MVIVLVHKKFTHMFKGPFSRTVSDSGISWAICKYALLSRQITMPAPHHSDLYMPPGALPAANQQCQSTEGSK